MPRCVLFKWCQSRTFVDQSVVCLLLWPKHSVFQIFISFSSYFLYVAVLLIYFSCQVLCISSVAYYSFRCSVYLLYLIMGSVCFSVSRHKLCCRCHCVVNMLSVSGCLCYLYVVQEQPWDRASMCHPALKRSHTGDIWHRPSARSLEAYITC